MSANQINDAKTTAKTLYLVWEAISPDSSLYTPDFASEICSEDMVFACSAVVRSKTELDQLYNGFATGDSLPFSQVKLLANRIYSRTLEEGVIPGDHEPRENSTQEAEHTMKALVEGLEPKVSCFSDEEISAVHNIALYETASPNYRFILVYDRSVGNADVEPMAIYRRLNGSSLYSETGINLSLQGNYDGTEPLTVDGELKATRSPGTRGDAGFYDVTRDFKIKSRNVNVLRQNLSCKVNAR